MVSFTTVVFGLVAIAVSGTNAFVRPCNAPYDVCGHTLASGDFGT